MISRRNFLLNTAGAAPVGGAADASPAEEEPAQQTGADKAPQPQ